MAALWRLEKALLGRSLEQRAAEIAGEPTGVFDATTGVEVCRPSAALPPQAREAALAASGATAAVQGEVRSLLQHALTDSNAFLAAPAAPRPGPAAAAADGTARPRESRREGQRVGPWRITAPLGRGGMGEVWLAQRDDGAYEGRAAVKVLRTGLDSQRVLDRFALEQRALARLDHPNIARLLDAGRTDDGQPCFVMEAVDGQPIDQACAGLPLEQIPFAVPVTPLSGAPDRIRGRDGWPDQAIPRQVVYQVTLVESALELCRQGLAAAYLPRFLVKLHNEQVLPAYQLVMHRPPRQKDGKLLQLGQQPVYLARRRSEVESRVFRQLARAIRAVCR